MATAKDKDVKEVKETASFFLGFDVDPEGKIDDYEISDVDVSEAYQFQVEVTYPIPKSKKYKVTISEV